MRTTLQKIVLLFAALLLSCPLSAQMFEGDLDWEGDEDCTLVMAKWSELYYELNVGRNVTPDDPIANFLYFAIGIGVPVNTKNAWRFFLPKQQIPDNEEDAELFGSMDTKQVYGGKIGLGLIHYFNHSVGMYAQANWGFLADFGSPSDTSSSSSSTKKTFIYNTIPVELGLCMNCWQHLHIQCGATYMWKKIPIVTAGIGYMF